MNEHPGIQTTPSPSSAALRNHSISMKIDTASTNNESKRVLLWETPTWKQTVERAAHTSIYCRFRPISGRC